MPMSQDMLPLVWWLPCSAASAAIVTLIGQSLITRNPAADAMPCSGSSNINKQATRERNFKDMPLYYQ